MAEVSFISDLQQKWKEGRKAEEENLIGVYLPLIGMHDALNIKWKNVFNNFVQ